MWLFVSSRLRQWVLLSVALPLTLAALRWLRRRLEARHGSTKLTRGLSKADSLGARVTGKEHAHSA